MKHFALGDPSHALRMTGIFKRVHDLASPVQGEVDFAQQKTEGLS